MKKFLANMICAFIPNKNKRKAFRKKLLGKKDNLSVHPMVIKPIDNFKSDKVLLTVNVVTYNQALWISQCLESILAQQTNFGIVIRIFDDCSTDGTTEICQKYAEKYPEKIKFFPTQKNLGPTLNPLRSYQHIDTPYYMYIEGDDYRLDTNSFQKQVAFLEANPECSFCAAKTINFENYKYVNSHPNLPSGIYGKDELLKSPSLYCVANLGTRIVRTKMINIDEKFPQIYLWDISQFFYLLEQGKMCFLNEDFMVYRMTGTGEGTGKNGLDLIRYMENLAHIFCDKYPDWLLHLLNIIKIELCAAINREVYKKKFK